MYSRSEECITGTPPKPEQKTGYEPRYMRTIRERCETDRATDEMWREIKATYYGMISRLDDQFGRVMKCIEEKGLWKDTVTMFFTDHGKYLGDYGLIEKWPSGLSNSLTHEPLIIGGAGLPEGAAITRTTEMVDLVPTVLELSGIGGHFPHNGKSWLPLLRGGEGKHKAYAFSEVGFLANEEPLLEQASYPSNIKMGLQHEDSTLAGKAISARDENWTYVYRLYEPAELYARRDDPNKMHNLAADPEHMGIADRFERATLRWLVGGTDFLPGQKDLRFPQVDLKSPRKQDESR